MQSFREIQKQVYAWSVMNFGLQCTPYLGSFHAGNIYKGRPRTKHDEPDEIVPVRTVAALGSLAPLLGVYEEVGELFEAATKKDTEDAIGDIIIYLCDYCAREVTHIPTYTALNMVDTYEPRTGLIVYAGKLAHCTLKHHQRIRGMEDTAAYAQLRDKNLVAFVWHLCEFTKQELPNTTILQIANRTWNNIVSKRDWGADANKGGGHDHNKPMENNVGGTDAPAAE